jgi:hypothetical protein
MEPKNGLEAIAAEWDRLDRLERERAAVTVCPVSFAVGDVVWWRPLNETEYKRAVVATLPDKSGLLKIKNGLGSTLSMSMHWRWLHKERAVKESNAE